MKSSYQSKNCFIHKFTAKGDAYGGVFHCRIIVVFTTRRNHCDDDYTKRLSNVSEVFGGSVCSAALHSAQ